MLHHFIVVAIVPYAIAATARAGTDCRRPIGVDVIVGVLTSTANWGSVGDIAAFSVGTTSCNVGDEELLWEASNNLHPVIGQEMFRLKDGRFEQIGMSWLKHGFLALAHNACGCGCDNPGTGTRLGVGCSDPYSSSLNGSQSGLGPRFEVDANTGAFSYPYTLQGQTGNAIYKRLQVHHSDLDPALNPGATYFVTAHYVTPDDAAAGNHYNNVSYRGVNVSGGGSSWSISVTGSTQQESPAIAAWQAADPGVAMQQFDDPEGGRFWLGYRVTVNKDETYHYEYALYNMNSHLSGRRFSVPVPDGVILTNIEFHDVDYHSGEPYDGMDWTDERSGGVLTWSTDTFDTDEFANALRWGTLYNFRFDADSPPQAANATVGLFRPADTDFVVVPVLGPSGPPETSVGAFETVVLDPGDGSCDPATTCTPLEDSLLELTETCGSSGVVSAEALDTDVHPDAFGYRSFGRTLSIETDLSDGCFKATLVMPFTLADFSSSTVALDVILTWYDAATNSWIPATCGNSTVPDGCPGLPVDVSLETGPAPPSLADLHARALGAYGVYWNGSQGFAWANTDHASDFSLAISNEQIPTVSQWGAAMVVLLLLTAGCVVIRKREACSP